MLDEVQWADDSERGSAWTRLLLAGEYRHILLLGAVEALPLIENAFPQAEVRFFERKAPLDWTGAVSFQSLRPGTVVVAFSRRAVLALAGELNRRQPGKVAVLYGAMPLASRRLEIERFVSGEADGLLRDRRPRPRRQPPVRDASLRRVAEVRRRGAARSARLGDRADRGSRGPLRARRARPRRRAHRDRLGERRPRPDPLRARPARAAPGGHMGYRVVDTARLRPRLEDLPVDVAAAACRRRSAPGTRAALRQWATDGWLSVESIGPLLVRLDAVQRRLLERGRKLSLEQTGSSSTRPSTRTTSSCSRRSRWRSPATGRSGPCCSGCSTRAACATPRSRTPSRPRARRASCAGSRSSIRTSAASRSRRRPRSRRRRRRRVSEKLAAEVSSPSVGRCKSCGQSCAPWFVLCERCYGRR